MGEAEARVIEFAVRNGGVVGRDEALAMGMSSRTLDRRVAIGALIIVSPGILALPGVTQNERTILRAAASAIGGVASHQSAARLHRLYVTGPEVVEVTVPIRRTNRFLSVVVHQSTDLDPGQTTEIDELPTTDIERTVMDLASRYKGKRLGDLVDEAVDRGATSLPRLSDRLHALARRGKPGVTNLRKVLETRGDPPQSLESALERRLLRILTMGGLPTPEVQYRPTWLKIVDGRVDLAYIEERTIVEADGRRWHRSPEAFQADRRRDNLAQLAGWTILRFTWDDVTNRPEYVVATVRGALGRSERIYRQ